MAGKKSDPVLFSFESSAIAPDSAQVTGFEGSEEISRPYRFRIELVSEDPDIDMDRLLYAPASLSLTKGDHERRIHGIVAECQLADALPDHRFCYQVVLRPRIWLLGLSRQNQIYQNLSVPEIIAGEIKADTARGVTKDAKAGLLGDDFELRLTQKYAKREYTVQYQESDLDFISRLMEHEGISYFFEQGDDREKMIITDNNIHFAAMAENDTLPYRSQSGLDGVEDESVRSFVFTNQRVPRKVVLKDYNYRLPHVMLQSDSEVDKDAHGLVCDYGDHFETPEAGSELARVRAQELLAGKKTFKGTSDSIRLQAGCRFKLDEHFRQSFNSEYVVIRVAHEGRQPLEGIAGIDRGAAEQAYYGNTLGCIPAEVTYRPPRRTPKPVMPGLMNAHVDAALLENRAELDDQGRYKLVMPYDLSGAAAGKATRYVRKAQPYGGRDMGMHFPLHKGTEVICSFVNGDPDRPVITGVVPNPATNSVVTSENYTKNVIKTGHGSALEFSDGRGPANTPRKHNSGQGQLSAQQQHQSVAGAFAADGRYGTPANSDIRDMPPASSANHLTPQQQHQLSTVQESDTDGANDVWFRVDVPDYDAAQDGSQSSYLRLGAQPTNGSGDVDESYAVDNDVNAPAGWFDFTSGDRTSVTLGNKEEKVYATDGWCSYEGIHKIGPVARKFELGHTSSFAAAFGDEESYFAGSQIEGFMGLKTELALASALELYEGIKYEAHLDWNFECGVQGTVNIINGNEYSLVDEHQTFGTDIKLHVLPHDPTPSWQGVVYSIFQTMGVLVGAGVAAGKTASHLLDSDGEYGAWDIANAAFDAASHGASLAGHIGMLVASVAYKAWIRQKQTANIAVSQLNMGKEQIELKCGLSSIVLNRNGQINVKANNFRLVSANKVFIKAKDFGAIGEQKSELVSPSNVRIKSLGDLILEGAAKADVKGPVINIGTGASKVDIKGATVSNG